MEQAAALAHYCKSFADMRLNMKCDLNFLLEEPDFSTKAKLTIDALAPLSMVTSMPGKYYRSQPEPTDEMLYGLLENALGWHISTKERRGFSDK
jgi:CRISPR-associated protein Cas5